MAEKKQPRADNDAPEIPSTLERSDEHAEDIYRETLKSAIEQYGDNERAYQTAWAAVKDQYEKKGDKWVKKVETKREKSHAV